MRGCGARRVAAVTVPLLLWISSSAYPPTKEKPPKVPTCVRGGSTLRLCRGSENLWQPRRPPSQNLGRLARRRGDGGRL